MKIDRYLTSQHPLSRIYRGGAAVFGIGLVVFGALGLSARLSFISTSGVQVFGLSTNGLLSLISIVVGLILLGAAIRGGSLASTITTVIGVLFFLSGLGNLAVLNTQWNLLAFEMQNVAFSLVAGMLLMFVGLYGRLSGGLADDNPYVRYRHHEPPGNDLPEQRRAEEQRIAELKPLSDAEMAFGDGLATPEQERTVLAEARRKALAERKRAYEHYAAEQARQQRRRSEPAE